MELNVKDENIWKFIKAHEQDNPAQLVLQEKRYPNLPIKQIAAQIAARQKAKNKLPQLYAKHIWFPSKLSLEQCSSEATATFKASLVQGARVADLTGGFGIDTFYLSKNFQETHYVEQQEELCKLASYNYSVLQTNIKIHHSESESFLKSIKKPMDWIYLDPARRDNRNQKVFLWEDCSPDVVKILPLLFKKAKNIMVKAAPMQDISRAVTELGNKVGSVYIVEWRNEVKELLYILSDNCTEKPTIHAIQLAKDGTVKCSFSGDKIKETKLELFLEMPKLYLYEPSPAIMKTGLFKQICSKFGVYKLHQNSHLFTSDQASPDFPGRSMRIVQILPVHKKTLKKHLPTLKANLSTRNFPMSVAQLKKNLNLKDGGNSYLFATTLKNEEKVLILCEKI